MKFWYLIIIIFFVNSFGVDASVVQIELCGKEFNTSPYSCEFNIDHEASFDHSVPWRENSIIQFTLALNSASNTSLNYTYSSYNEIVHNGGNGSTMFDHKITDSGSHYADLAYFTGIILPGETIVDEFLFPFFAGDYGKDIELKLLPNGDFNLTGSILFEVINEGEDNPLNEYYITFLPIMATILPFLLLMTVKMKNSRD